MSRNIYDLFNERKNSMETLNESSYDFVQEYETSVEDAELFEAAEAYETLEEALEVLDNITESSNMEIMEMQAAQYLEELVIESMMYENFVVEAAEEVIDAHEGEGKKKLIEQIQDQWQKIKEWFAQLIKTLQNFFVNGAKLVEKNKAVIPDAIKNCDVKVKMAEYYPFKMAMVKVGQKVGQAFAMAKGVKQADHQSVLRAVGVEDKKEIPAMTRAFFIKSEAKEMKISEINAATAMDWCETKNHVYDGFMKLKLAYDLSFQNMLAEVKKDSKGDLKELTRRCAVMYFANGVRNEIVKAAASCSKAACTNYTAVIRRALSGKVVKPGDGKERGPKRPGPQLDPKQKTLAEPAKESFSLFDDIEDIQFMDEVDE